ncbi:MAG: hypothetical protein DRO92_02450 [Candidatus Altiarchaeales archaeon]|nr:MAG: hypothetical protein DRO92_02450 [Candidatus Altiarchaeales archaeon]
MVNEKKSLLNDPVMLIAGACFVFLIGIGVGILIFNFVNTDMVGNITSNKTTTTASSIITTTLKPENVNLLILNDKRCKECDVERLVGVLKERIPNLRIEEIDYSTERGKELYNSLGIKYLPALLFDSNIKNSDEYSSLSRYLEIKGDYYSLRMGARFDPTAEICDNGIDDDGNGLIDCDDPHCKNEFVCMEKKEKVDVELFVMAYCPFGTQTEKGILPVVKLLGDKINFYVKFCDYAMHGKKEIDEQLLQYCIQRNFGDRYIDYLECFLKEGKTDECLNATGIDREILNRCINKTDNEFKITERYNDKTTWLNGRFPIFPIHQKEVQRYGIRGSPGLAINGIKVERFRRDPAGLLNIICSGFKDKPEECNESLSSTTPSPGFGFSGSGSNSGGCGR